MTTESLVETIRETIAAHSWRGFRCNHCRNGADHHADACETLCRCRVWFPSRAAWADHQAATVVSAVSDLPTRSSELSARLRNQMYQQLDAARDDDAGSK